jgi:hypothetical protein
MFYQVKIWTGKGDYAGTVLRELEQTTAEHLAKGLNVFFFEQNLAFIAKTDEEL